VKYFISIAIFGLILFSCEEKPKQGEQVFVSTGKAVLDGYWVYLPENYDPSKAYPLILFLQGGAGKSDNIRSTKNDGPSKFALKDLPVAKDSFIILNPHMKIGDPDKNRWSRYDQAMNWFIDDFSKTYPIDKNRIYLTGLSYGAQEGALILNRGNMDIRAFIGVAGRYSRSFRNKENIRKTDIWLVHRKDDPQVRASNAINLMNSLYSEEDFIYQESIEKNKELNVLTILEGDTHTGWDETFSTVAIYEWLLSKK